MNGRVGRPSRYSAKLARQITRRISRGEPLRDICRSDGHPSESTVRDWLKKRADFSLMMKVGREVGMPAFARRFLRDSHGITDPLKVAAIIAREWAGTSCWGVIARWWPAKWLEVRKSRPGRKPGAAGG